MATRSRNSHVVERPHHEDPHRRHSSESKEVRRPARPAKSMAIAVPPAAASRPTSARSSISVLSTTSTLISVGSSPPKYGKPTAPFVKPFDRSYRRRAAASTSSIDSFQQRFMNPNLALSHASIRLGGKPGAKSFVYRDGRRYLHDSKYMLPHDLQEIQRQNLSTILMTTVFGSPISSPIDPLNPPRTILDIGCADGFWSVLCHDFFTSLGLQPPAFTGLDIARQGPDLRNAGVDWTFVNHDLETRPLPFADDTFDVIMVQDMAVAIAAETWLLLVPQLFRILRPGGYLEFRDRDYVFRTMQAPPRKPINTTIHDALTARETGCYLVTPENEFVDCENKYLRDVSEWTDRLMLSRGHQPRPIAALEALKPSWGFEQAETRRIAIPLCHTTNWESGVIASATGEVLSVVLDAQQQALRSTALEVVIDCIEALEAPLRRLCGKNEEEWRRWWNFMVTNLVEEGGAAAGECLEIGAVWARKKSTPKEQ